MRGWIVLAVILLIALVLAPVAVISRIRSQASSKPRVHMFMDMALQPKLKPQQTTPVFADHSAWRPPVAETIARGELRENALLETGKLGNDWATTFPMPVTDAMMSRGQERFGIYCAACHGFDGAGDGMVAVRAAALQQAAFVKPASYHSDLIRARPVGHIFNTITAGMATMPGYAVQIPVEDRWAIVAYVRALQRSRNARIEEVPRGTTMPAEAAVAGTQPAAPTQPAVMPQPAVTTGR